ncbi:hypothetical protein ACTJIV_08500 [Chryseobacterium sp. 22532]|uniref:hypothetical protein n=1 Tax=Chryseobacterium sp. 22532 TaxID=3453938 RepID=UPI003F852733
MMKKGFKYLIIGTISILFFVYIFLPFASNYIGWYGYSKWKYRHGTDNIQMSKNRNIFIKQLNYKIIDSAGFKNFRFTPYLEKGFKYGKHFSEDTRIIQNSSYPYNICYERNLKDSIVLRFTEDSVKKLDSSDVVWGYSKTPYLKDTLMLIIEGPREHAGLIKIW